MTTPQYTKAKATDFVYKKVSKEELNSLMYNHLIDDEKMNIPIFKGFHYFSPVDVSDEHHVNYFIVALTKESNEVVGVMKLKCWSSYPHVQHVPEADTNSYDYFTAINFVDVKSPYKRTGIATNLYRELNSTLNFDDTVVGSRLSEEGVLAKLKQIRKTYITACPVYSTYDDYVTEIEEECDDEW